MSTDITSFFKAVVRTVRTRNKGRDGGKDSSHSSILSHAKHKTEFSIKSREVINTITKLKEFLLEHRKDYINAASHLSLGEGQMSNAERDHIDTDALKFMRTCAETIRQFKLEVFKQAMTYQVIQHREIVFELLEDYLKVVAVPVHKNTYCQLQSLMDTSDPKAVIALSVCKLYSEQRAVRVKRVVDKKRISRLHPNQRAISSHHGPTARMAGPIPPDHDLTNQEADDDQQQEISPEEAQMFEEENKQLFNEMNCIVDEVRQLEGKVVEITKLQEIFADKVLQQETDIDRIADVVVETTENIKEGNEDIREAIKNNAGFRVWILFFLVMCSFSLLFLDWYS